MALVKDNPIWGIDLGTTNSLIALYRDEKIEIISIDGDYCVPSIVALDEEQKILVGKKAKEFAKKHPERVIFSNKRKIGENYYYQIDGKRFSPVEISSFILNYLVAEAGKQTQSVVKDVVITVPAYFNDTQRKNTILSGEQVGLNVIRLVNEPTAAALAYDYIAQEMKRSDSENWLIYDLGGGTFDITILKVKNNGYKEVIVSLGDNFLGGDDFDSLLIGWIKSKITSYVSEDFFSKRENSIKIKILAEKSKWLMSTSGKEGVIIDLSSLNIDGVQSLEIKNRVFENLITDMVELTLEIIDKSLELAKLKKNQIDKILFVGGSTEIPFVRKKVESYLGKDGERLIDPHHAVVLGAAVQSAISQAKTFKSTIIDIAPHSLGMAAIGEFDRNFFCREKSHPLNEDGESLDKDLTKDEMIEIFCKNPPRTFVPVIERMTKLPAVFVKKFFIGHENQRFIPLAIYQGESPCNDDNNLVGIYVVEFSPMKKGSAINIEMQYDLNGSVKVRVFLDEIQDKKDEEDEKDEIVSFQLNLYNQEGAIHLLNRNSDSLCGTKTHRLITNDLISKIEKQQIENEAVLTSEENSVNDLLKQYMGALINGNDQTAGDLEKNLKEIMEREDQKGQQDG